MGKKKPASLGEHDHIVTAWAEHCEGPGWSNRLVSVLVRNAADGKHRVVYLQPEEQSEEMWTLFDIAATVSKEMTGAAARLLNARADGTG